MEIISNGTKQTREVLANGTWFSQNSFRLEFGLGESTLVDNIIVYWSDEDHAFIVEVPELPGCMADGATYQDAIANVEVIIQEWIETAQELGRPIPEPRGRLVYA